MRIVRFIPWIRCHAFIMLVFVFVCAYAGMGVAQAQASKQVSERQSIEEREGELRASKAATVEGRVFDHGTGKPVANAIVGWSFDDQIHSGYTNASGQFKFLVAQARGNGGGANFDISASGVISLRITANLYQTEQTRVPIQEGKTISVEIGLRPKPQNEIGMVRGIVMNKDSGQPFQNVVVSILGTGQPLMTITGTDGSFTITGVGFSRNLTIQFRTVDIPCIAPVTQPLEVASGVVTVNLAVPVLKLPVVHCHS
ncbi:carboxypeptidase-like regulatory domain-containing protein [Paraburkholderia dipogonis]|uniref:Carboxypeptidase-like regulatory domain-containing protein n=1 Tax=Paraburkholderia dipogonis TaxID=1211383 RepID=A0ABW9B6I3_9BURK